jgi:hypothetical protein
MPKIVLPKLDLDTLHTGSGFCETCCRQVASSQNSLLAQADEYFYVTKQVLLMMAEFLGTPFFALCMFATSLLQGRPRTQIEIEALERERREWSYLEEEEDQRHWEAFAKQHQKLISQGVPNPDSRGFVEYDNKVRDMTDLVQNAEEGYVSPFYLAKETDDLCKLRADLVRRDERRRKLEREANFKIQLAQRLLEKPPQDPDEADQKAREAQKLLHEADLMYRDAERV